MLLIEQQDLRIRSQTSHLKFGTSSFIFINRFKKCRWSFDGVLAPNACRHKHSKPLTRLQLKQQWWLCFLNTLLTSGWSLRSSYPLQNPPKNVPAGRFLILLLVSRPFQFCDPFYLCIFFISASPNTHTWLAAGAQATSVSKPVMSDGKVCLPAPCPSFSISFPVSLFPSSDWGILLSLSRAWVHPCLG